MKVSKTVEKKVSSSKPVAKKVESAPVAKKIVAKPAPTPAPVEESEEEEDLDMEFEEDIDMEDFDDEDMEEDNEGDMDEEQLKKLIDASTGKVSEVATKLAAKGISTNAGTVKAKSAKRKAPEEDLSDRGVVLVSRIPYGFFEEQMRGFFSQFGTITRLRISRNRKTGKSRHFGFIEFESREVAAIVADTMNGYMMFGRTLECKYLPPSQVHPNTFRNADRKFKIIPWARLQRERHNAPKTAEQVKALNARVVKREDKRRKALAALGYDYDFSGYAGKKIDQGEAKKAKKSVSKKVEEKPVVAVKSASKKVEVKPVTVKSATKKIEEKPAVVVKSAPKKVEEKPVATVKSASKKVEEKPAIVVKSASKKVEEKPIVAVKSAPKKVEEKPVVTAKKSAAKKSSSRA